MCAHAMCTDSARTFKQSPCSVCSVNTWDARNGREGREGRKEAGKANVV